MTVVTNERADRLLAGHGESRSAEALGDHRTVDRLVLGYELRNGCPDLVEAGAVSTTG